MIYRMLFSPPFGREVLFTSRLRCIWTWVPDSEVDLGMNYCISPPRESFRTAVFFGQRAGMPDFPVHRVCMLDSAIGGGKGIVAVLFICKRTRISCWVVYCSDMGSRGIRSREGSCTVCLFCKRTWTSDFPVHRVCMSRSTCSTKERLVTFLFLCEWTQIQRPHRRMCLAVPPCRVRVLKGRCAVCLVC